MAIHIEAYGIGCGRCPLCIKSHVLCWHRIKIVLLGEFLIGIPALERPFFRGRICRFRNLVAFFNLLFRHRSAMTVHIERYRVLIFNRDINRRRILRI